MMRTVLACGCVAVTLVAAAADWLCGPARRNCLSITAYDGSGSALARNYALFEHYSRATVFTIR